MKIIIIIIIIKPVSRHTYSISLSLQCSCKYTSISFAVKPIDEVCVEVKLAFAMEGSHRTC